MRCILTIIGVLLFGCSIPNDDEIVIATASNMRFAMEELTGQFTTLTGIKCNMVVSSSGKLTAQIKEGAPFDMLVSADMKYPIALMEAGLTADTPSVYAYGKLVLWSAVAGYEPVLGDLVSENIEHIAVANPETAPYGAAAEEVLKKYGVLEEVQHKLVFGESISQVNQFIVSRSATLGFTAKSVVLSNQMKGTGNWVDLDQNYYTPIEQGVAVIDNHRQVKSMQFFEFLLSSDGQEILQKYGYAVSDE